jgi:hypothetical protein
MSWLRIEGRMPHHRKVAPLSDAAFRLHVTATCWAVEEGSDGEIPRAIPATLPAAPRGRALQQTIAELVAAGLWESRDGGDFAIHDFLIYNPSARAAAELRAARASAGQVGGRRSAEQRASKPEAIASPVASGLLYTLPKQNPSPIPIPIPIPIPGDPIERSERARGDPEQAEPALRLTICPLDLLEKAESAGIVRDFVEKYRAEPEQIRDAVRNFVTYWTIGAGIGRKEANWPRKLRRNLQILCEKPGGLRAPGEMEHEKRQPRRVNGGSESSHIESSNVPSHQLWQMPDYLKD